ncbi:hypothetical protein STEG23_008176, partial [Scotinomys teguina]
FSADVVSQIKLNLKVKDQVYCEQHNSWVISMRGRGGVKSQVAEPGEMPASDEEERM